MDKEEIKKILIEHGVPENQVEEMADRWTQVNPEIEAELERQHREGVNEPIQISNGIYLNHLMNNETDWKKRAQIAAMIASMHLDS